MKTRSKLRYLYLILFGIILLSYFGLEYSLYKNPESLVTSKINQFEINAKSDLETLTKKINQIGLQEKTLVRFKSSDYLNLQNSKQRSQTSERMFSFLKSAVLSKSKSVILVYDFLSEASCGDKILFLKNVECPQSFQEIENFFKHGIQDVVALSKTEGIKSIILGWDVNIYFFRLKKLESYVIIEKRFWKSVGDIKDNLAGKTISVGLNFDQLKAYNFWGLIDNDIAMNLNFLSFSIWLVDQEFGKSNFKQSQMYLLDSDKSPLPKREVDYYRARLPKQKTVLYYDLGHGVTGNGSFQTMRRSELEKHIGRKGNLFANPI